MLAGSQLIARPYLAHRGRTVHGAHVADMRVTRDRQRQPYRILYVGYQGGHFCVGEKYDTFS